MENTNAPTKKVLVIEDDVFLGDVLVQKLTKYGFEATLAKDGAEGLQKIRSIKPDLILLDIILPSMNGYEILEAKIKDPSISGIPVIVISNSGQPVEINRVVALGVSEYIVKAQFDPDEVMVKVRQKLRDGISAKRGGMSKNSSAGDITLEGKKVMWVEDDKFLNDIIARKLSNTKCAFFHSADGEEAILIIQKEMPDVILLDIILSGMDGFEILKRIKSDPAIKNIPVIVLSNLSQDSDMKRAKDLGATKFIVKATVTLDDIVAELARVIAESASTK